MKTKNEKGLSRLPGALVLRVRTQGEVRALLVGDDEANVCALINGQNSVDEILSTCSLPGFVTTRVLQALIDRGVAEPVPPTPVAVTPTVSGRTGQTLDFTELFTQRRTLQGPVAAAERRLQASSPVPEPEPSPVVTAPSVVVPVEPALQVKSRTASGELDVPAESTRGRRSSPYMSFVYPPEPAAPPPVTPAPEVRNDPEDAPPIEPPSGLEKRIHVGPYRVVGRLAKGGVGSVYLCSRGGPFGFRRLFALKVIRQHIDTTIDAERAFADEARIGGKLSHPNLNGVLDAGLYEQQPYLIMPYVEGLNLYELIAQNRAGPAPLVISVICDVLRGLQCLHDLVDDEGRPMHLVHGDLSPDNILVGVDGAARLTDFGRVRSAGAVSPVGANGLVGKPGFTAPEQLQGQKIDARTDLFTLGIVLWTALTGKPLFAEDTFEATVMNILRRPVERPSVFGAPACFDGICLQALARGPEGRFKSADDMRMALITAAAANGLLASSAQVAQWVRDAGGEQLAERRRLIALDAVEAALGPSGPEAPGAVDRGLNSSGRGHTMVLPRQGGTPRMGVQVQGRRTTVESDPPRSAQVDDDDGAPPSKRSLIIAGVVAAVVLASAILLFASQSSVKNAPRSSPLPAPRAATAPGGDAALDRR